MRFLIFAFVSLFFSMSCVMQSLANDWQFNLGLNVTTSPANGFIQTPKGGAPGTSSSDRPTLDELGIDRVTYGRANADLGWRQWRVFTGLERIRPEGQNTLAQSLITHGVVVPAGTAIDARLKFDLYNAALGYRFPLHNNRFGLTPFIGSALLDFNYVLRGLVPDRAYTKSTSQAGALLDYDLTQRASISLLGAASLPVFDRLKLYSLETGIDYQVLQRSRFSAGLHLGTGVTHLDFEDKQPMPNHLRLTLGLEASAGLRLCWE